MRDAGPLLGLALLALSAVAMMSAIAAWGDRLLYALAWSIVTVAEMTR